MDSQRGRALAPWHMLRGAHAECFNMITPKSRASCSPRAAGPSHNASYSNRTLHATCTCTHAGSAQLQDCGAPGAAPHLPNGVAGVCGQRAGHPHQLPCAAGRPHAHAGDGGVWRVAQAQRGPAPAGATRCARASHCTALRWHVLMEGAQQALSVAATAVRMGISAAHSIRAPAPASHTESDEQGGL